MNLELANAVREIQRLAIASAEGKVVNVKVPDGKDGVVDLPVLLLADGDGKTRAQPLTDEITKHAQLAERLRLAKADGPDRRVGTAQHEALQSFIEHAVRFKAEHSAVWANAARRELVSVLDYHPAGATSAPKWGKHRGTYLCPLSEAWQAWGGGKSLELDQDAFAALLDQRDRELTGGDLPAGGKAPDPTFLISLASKLEVYSHASAKRERDPNTGRVRISYSEDKGVSGDVLPPPAFLIHIPIFEDADPQTLEVRLRVTVEDAHAKFSVTIHAVGQVLREAFESLCDHVGAETGLPVFIGTPGTLRGPMAKPVEVVQQEGAEVPTEVLAQAIVAVSDAATKLMNGRLTRRAVLVPIRDATKNTVSLEVIETVLDAAAELRRRYTR